MGQHPAPQQVQPISLGGPAQSVPGSVHTQIQPLPTELQQPLPQPQPLTYSQVVQQKPQQQQQQLQSCQQQLYKQQHNQQLQQNQLQQQLTQQLQQQDYQQQQQQQQSQQVPPIQLQARFFETVREAVKDEVAVAMRELANTIYDTVLRAMCSGAVTAQRATPDPQVEKAHIMDLLRQGKLSAAFIKALSAENLDLVIRVCQVVNPDGLFNQSPCPFNQIVLLSLIQQLSTDLENHTELKQKYLAEAVMNLDPNDSLTQAKRKDVLYELNQNLRKFISAHPNNQVTRSLKLLQMMSESLLK